MRNAKVVGNAKPEQTLIVKGIARQNRSMVVEVIERAN
jgi:hypothetical protein